MGKTLKTDTVNKIHNLTDIVFFWFKQYLFNIIYIVTYNTI